MPTVGRFNDELFDTNGRPVRGNAVPAQSASVLVKNADGTTATLYHEDGVTTTPNPINYPPAATGGPGLDTLGNLTFWAPTAGSGTRYQLVVTPVGGTAGAPVDVWVEGLGGEVADDTIESRHIQDGSVTPPKLSFVALTSDDLGKPIGLVGAVQPTRLVGATVSGAPTTGTFQVGDFVTTHDGNVLVCTVAGSPGTWSAPPGSGTASGPAGGHLTGSYPNPSIASGIVTEAMLAFSTATQDELNTEATTRTNAIADLKAQLSAAVVETSTGYPARPTGFRLVTWYGPTDPGAAMTAEDVWIQKDVIAPPTPTGLAGTSGDTQATLTWDAVTASDLAGYRLYRNGVQVFQGTATTRTDTGLTNGTTYAYSVTSYDTLGNESAASPTVSVTPGGLASAPGTPTATAGNASATVNWTAPSSNGGSAITGYRVTPYIGTTAQTPTTVGNVLTANITGLTNGTEYTFKVAAINAAGTGPDSASSNAVTPVANNITLVQNGTPVQTNGTSVTGTLPANPTVGNTVFALVSHIDANTVAAANMNAPTGFTELYKVQTHNGSLACAIYYRKTQSGDSNSVTFTQTGTTARVNTIQLIELSNIADAPAGRTGVASATGVTTISVATTEAIADSNSYTLAMVRVKGGTPTWDLNSWTNGFTSFGNSTGLYTGARKATAFGDTPSTALTWTTSVDAMAIISSLKGV